MRCAGHAARMGESRDVYRVLWENLSERDHLGGQRRRCDDNIKMDIQDFVWGGGHGLDPSVSG
jgi:hypothetical protein